VYHHEPVAATDIASGNASKALAVLASCPRPVVVQWSVR
jgi:hypothetical protein